MRAASSARPHARVMRRDVDVPVQQRGYFNRLNRATSSTRRSSTCARRSNECVRPSSDVGPGIRPDMMSGATVAWSTSRAGGPVSRPWKPTPPAYSMSKTAVNAFTRQLAAATKGTGVLVNSACPAGCGPTGWHERTKSVEEGADTIVWLATCPPGGPTGVFQRPEDDDW